MSALLLTIQICLTLLAAGCAVAAYKRGSVSSRSLKRLNELEVMVSDLQSTFESLLESHKRLRSRAGMRELREREAEPGPESKSAIRKRLFGVAAGPAFAARQVELNARHKD